MRFRDEVAKRIQRRISDEREQAEAEFRLREKAVQREALQAERDAAAAEAQQAADWRQDQDAKNAARLEALMQGMQLDLSELGTPEERQMWLDVTGLGANALSRAASAGDIAEYLAMPNLVHASTVDNLHLPRPHVRHLLAIQALHSVYRQTLNAAAQAREDQLQAARRAALDAEADRLLAVQDADYAQRTADVARLEG
jgi:hypothetical protein